VTFGIGTGFSFGSVIALGLKCALSNISIESSREHDSTMSDASTSCPIDLPLQLYPEASVSVRLPANIELRSAVRYVVGAPTDDGSAAPPQGLAVGVSLGLGI
jgi:hypothetical protein